MATEPNDFNKPELFAKYVSTGKLSKDELRFLRKATSRHELEAMAVGLAHQKGVSRSLYKLWNILFATKNGPKKPPPATKHPNGMFQTIRSAKPGVGGEKTVTGGGANGTSKRP